MEIKELTQLLNSCEIALKAKDWGLSAKGPVALVVAFGVIFWLIAG